MLPKTNASQASPASSDTASNTASNAASNAAETISPSSSSSSTANGSVSQATAPVATAKPALTSSGSTASPAAGPVATALTVPERAAPAPSQQQLVSWAQPNYEPLDLLKVVNNNKLGFTESIAALPDGSGYVLGGSTVSLWSIGKESPEHVFVDSRNAADKKFKALAIAPDGAWLAFSDSQGNLSRWSLQDRKEIVSKKVAGNSIPCLAISPDSTTIATANYNGEVSVWDAKTLASKKQFKLDSRGIKQLCFIAPQVLVTAAESMDSWDVSSGDKIKNLSSDRYYSSISASKNGELFTFADSKGLQIRKVSDGELVVQLLGSFSTDEIVSLSSDGKLAATANSGLVRIWSLQSGQVIQAIDNRGMDLVGIDWLPGKPILAMASMLRRTRLWGAPREAASIGLAPIHPKIAAPEPTATDPATPFQMLSAIDLRSFPKFPGAKPLLETHNMLTYNTTASIEDAQLFCRYQFHQKGWTETTQATNIPGNLTFSKNGFRLNCTVADVPNQGTAVSMVAMGNLDLRRIPKPDSVPVTLVYESEDTVMLKSKASLLAIEIALMKQLHSLGWTAYSRLRSSHNEQDNARDLTFLKNGTELRITIGRFPSDPDTYNIQYGTFLAANSIPIPKDAGFVEFDAAPEMALVANTKLSMQDIAAFYNREMVTQGWMSLENSIKEKDGWISFLRGQQDITIGMSKLDNGWTRLVVGRLSAKDTWQLADAEDKKATKSETPKQGIEAADFPIHEKATEIKYETSQASIVFAVPNVTLDALMDFYSKKLAEIGWAKDARGVISQEYSMVEFSKKDAATFIIRATLQGAVAKVNIQGDSILWTKELPTGKQLISYSGWLRKNQHPTSLELLDKYQSEMLELIKTR